MFRALAGNLVLNERIRTTDAKAKELRRVVERMITKATRLGEDLTVDLGKISDDDKRLAIANKRMHAQRDIASFLPHRLEKTVDRDETIEVNLVHKLFHEDRAALSGSPRWLYTHRKAATSPRR